MFYKLGAHQALQTLGLAKAAQNPPPRPPQQPQKPPPPPPPKQPVNRGNFTIGGGTAQARRLREMGILPK